MMPEQNIPSIDNNPLKGKAIEKTVPSTEQQKELWLSCILGGEEGNLAYNQSHGLELYGNLNVDALKNALKKLVLRHEALRSSFGGDGSLMTIYEYSDPEVDYHDISTYPESQQKSIIEEYIKNSVLTPFDLINGPLFRISLFKKKDESFFLNLCGHHIICDGGSFRILFEDLSAIYNALCDNKPLPAAPDQFSVYAVENIRYQQTEKYTDIEGYWVDKFKNKVFKFDLPCDFERPPTRTYASRRDDYFISDAIIDGIRKVATANNCSFATTLLSSFEVLIYKLTGINNIVIGVPAADRAAKNVSNVVGHCVNLLPLKSSIAGKEPFGSYLKQRKTETLEDYDHKQFTFSSLLKKINIQRDPSRIPLVPVSFNVDLGIDKNVSFKDVKHSVIYIPRAFETFEIFLNIIDVKGGFVFQWSYNTQLFKPSTIKSFMDGYESLLIQIAASPETEINLFQIEKTKQLNNQEGLSENETEILRKYNDTAKEFELDTLDNLFYKHVKEYENKFAIWSEEEQWSYKKLNTISNQVAHYLLEKKLPGKSCIAIIGHRRPMTIALILGVLKAGATYVPIDPDYPIDRQEYIKSNSNVTVTLDFDSYEKNGLDQYDISDVKGYSNLNELAYIIYTSGSTGLPKGVMITHKAAANTILDINEKFGITDNDNIIGLSSLGFDLSVYDVFGALSTGATLHIIPDIRDWDKIMEILHKNKITFWNSVPSLMNLFIENLSSKNGDGNGILKNVLLSGDWIPLELPQKIKNYFPNALVTSLGGATEGSIWSIYYPIPDIDKNWKSIPYGYPLSNQKIFVLDSDLNFSAFETEGELYIGGDGVASGYFNDKEKTEKSFIHHDTLGYIYRTGDYGMFHHEGYIEFRGRKDSQVKIGGHRIELGEVEHHINQLQGIINVVCLARDVEKNTKILSCFLVPEDDNKNPEFTQSEIAGWRSSLKQKLPNYMIPSEWVKIKEIPLSSNNKVDRDALKNVNNGSGEKTAPNGFHSDSEATVFTQTETAIKNIWEEELQLSGISKTSDFFEIGGYSMTAIRVMNAIQKKFDKQFPINSLFQHSTIESLARLIDDEKEEKTHHDFIIPIARGNNKNPLFLIHGGALNVLVYKKLEHFFQEDQTVYAIRGIGLNGEAFEANSVEEISEIYLNEILKIVPDGPYNFVGYSLGGLIAFDLARQLMNKSKKVNFLGIIDTNVSDKLISSQNMVIKITKRQLKKVKHILNSLANHPLDTMKYQKIRFKQMLHVAKIEETEVEKIVDYSQETVKKYDSAYSNYRLSKIPVKIHLFRVDKRIYYVDDPVYLGWNAFTEKGVEIHEIPGDHKTFLIPPNNKIFARKLQRVLNQTNDN